MLDVAIHLNGGALVLKAPMWLAGLSGSSKPTDAATPRALSFDSDASNVALCLDGDEDAYRRIVERHQQSVGRLLWRFTRDHGEHEELVQQVFVEAYMGISGYRGSAPLGHWLARIATRIGYRHWNQRGRRPVSLSEEAWARLTQPKPDGIDCREAAELVHDLLAQLTPSDRLVLTLRYFEGCDVAETAYRIGWTEIRVRVTTHRAIKRLKRVAASSRVELEME